MARKPKKTPEETATDALETLVAKRDKLQSDLNDVNALLQTLGQSIGPAQHRSDPEMTATEVSDKPARKPKMAGEPAVKDPNAPVKSLATLMEDTKSNPDEFETTTEDKPEPDYAAILNEGQPTEVEEDLAGGDHMGAGRWG